MHDVGLGRGERSVGVSETLTVTLCGGVKISVNIHACCSPYTTVTLSTGVC